MKTKTQVLKSSSFTRSLLFIGVAAAFMLSLLVSSGLLKTVNAAPYDITEFDITTPSIGVMSMAKGPDGNVWFAGGTADSIIGKVTPSGVITEYEVPTQYSSPNSIAAGPDGNMWFVEMTEDKVGKVTTSGVFTEYDVPTSDSDPNSITAGPDGNIWFTQSATDKIAKVTTSGTFTEYDIPTSGAYPAGIVAGPDGNLWFTEMGANKIGKITTSGTITEYDIPTSGLTPLGITVGADNNLWFTGMADKIGKITTSGTITEYDVPTPGGFPAGITLGSDDNIWFTEVEGNKLASITTSGTITEYDIPTADSEVFGITGGADDNIWYVGFNSNKVGRLELPSGDSGGGGDPANESTFTNQVTGKEVKLVVDDDCTVEEAAVIPESSNATQDAGYNYQYGLMDFTIDCGTPGFEATIEQYYYGVTSVEGLVARKFNPNTGAYFNLTEAHDVSIEKVTIDNQSVAKLTYKITDGGELDLNSTGGVITDPVGLGSSSIGAPNTGIGRIN